MATRRKTRKSKAAKKAPAKKKKAPAKKKKAPAKKKKAPAKKKKAPAKKKAKKTAVGLKAPKLRRSATDTTKATDTKATKKTQVSRTPRKPELMLRQSRADSPTKKARSAAKTMPGGTAPAVDDVTLAKRALRDLRDILSRVGDADAELILGEGTLESLLASIVPAGRDGQTHQHLAKHKRRASLLARLRHGINERSVFRVDDRYVSPTRVQWFYDGLTFLEGDAPYAGVVSLFRDDVVRYALGVADATKDDSLGPLASDFVSVAEAKKSFRAVRGTIEEGLASLEQLGAEDDPAAWTTLLSSHPWMLGAQHTAIERVPRRDADLPDVTARRAADAAQDILLIEAPDTPIVGKTSKVLSSFRDIWNRAAQLRTFVQRQSGYLKRELGWRIREPRFLVLAGQELSTADRRVVRNDLERHHAAVRLVTYSELRSLAQRTAEFFQPRI